MKHSHYLLRAIQSATIIVALSIVIMLLSVFELIPFDKINDLFSNRQEQPVNQRVRRPRPVMNKSYGELLEMGDRANFVGNIEIATDAFRQAASIEPREPLAYEKLGDLFFQQKDYEAARQNFELAESLRPTSAMQIKIIKSILGLRKILEAKTELEKIQPETQDSIYYLGLISAFLNEQAQAKDLLARSINLANSDERKNNAQKILDVYTDFEIAKDAPAEFLQAMLAQAFDQVGEYALSIELAFDALKRQNDYRDIWIILGHAFLNERKWLDAEDALARAIQLDAGHPTPYFYRGIARQNLAKNLEALSDYSKALQFGWQPRILANLSMADTYFALQDLDQAYVFYREVLEADATDINKFVRPMALAINHLNKPAEALELAQIAFNAHQNTAMGHNLLGWALTFNNEFRSAHEHLEQAITLDPELDAAYLNLGLLYEKENNFRRAVENYRKAFELSEASGNRSIESTASQRYNSAIDKIPLQGTTTSENVPGTSSLSTPQNSPQQDFIPSLSLI